MELKFYLSILWRRKWVVLATFAFTLIAVVIGTSLTVPVYSASTTLRVAAAVGGSQIQTNPAYYEQLLNTYSQIAISRPILEELSVRLQVEELPVMQTEVIPDTELIRITAEDANPQMAALAANTLASILVEQSHQLYAGGATDSQEILASQLAQASHDLNQARQNYEKLIVQTPPAPEQIAVSGQLLDEKQRTYETFFRHVEEARFREAIQASLATIVETAMEPVSPSRPRPMLNYVLGALVGLMGGLLLGFVVENLDERLYETQAIEALLSIPAVGRLPKVSKKHLIFSNSSHSPLAESARYLALQLKWMDRQYPRRVLLLIGAEPAQGTSITSVNLACALSEQGEKVVVVDCNLRHPQLHLLLNVPNEHGLVDVLNGSMDLMQALTPTTMSGLSVLTTGSETAALLAGFAPLRIHQMIAELRQQFEFVLLDAPALTVADMAAFIPDMDGLLLVIRRSHARREAVHTAGAFLSMFEGKYVGSIINEAETQTRRSYAR